MGVSFTIPLPPIVLDAKREVFLPVHPIAVNEMGVKPAQMILYASGALR
jgi:hypothetical protein